MGRHYVRLDTPWRRLHRRGGPVLVVVDIEVLGRDTSKVQFTHWWGRAPNFKAQTFGVGFNVDQQFHEYTFEWLPDSITWYIDGIEKYTVTENIPNLPQQIMMNIWICTTSEWAGEFDSGTLPAYAEYDCVKFYQKDFMVNHQCRL